MPMVTDPASDGSPSKAIHSCSAVYLRLSRSVIWLSGRWILGWGARRSLGTPVERQRGHGRGDPGPPHVDGQGGARLAHTRRDEGHGDGVAECRAQRPARDLADGLVAV